jgi:hypothetical protein
MLRPLYLGTSRTCQVVDIVNLLNRARVFFRISIRFLALRLSRTSLAAYRRPSWLSARRLVSNAKTILRIRQIETEAFKNFLLSVLCLEKHLIPYICSQDLAVPHHDISALVRVREGRCDLRDKTAPDGGLAETRPRISFQVECPRYSVVLSAHSLF